MKEEAVIRERFEIYMALPIRKVETMRPVMEIVDALGYRVGAKWHNGNKTSLFERYFCGGSSERSVFLNARRS
jgi:hypothetical protein